MLRQDLEKQNTTSRRLLSRRSNQEKLEVKYLRIYPKTSLDTLQTIARQSYKRLIKPIFNKVGILISLNLTLQITKDYNY